MMVIRGWYDDDDGCGRLSRDSSFERGGGKMVRVRESDGRDRIHREVGSLFGLRRICPPENFSGGGEWWPAAGGGGRILGKKMSGREIYKCVKFVCWFSPLKSVKLISAIKARTLISHGCQGFLASVMDTSLESPNIENLFVVCEFADVFPDELPWTSTLERLNLEIKGAVTIDVREWLYRPVFHRGVAPSYFMATIMDPSKVEAITKWPRPTTVTEGEKFVWTDERQESFENETVNCVCSDITLPSVRSFSDIELKSIEEMVVIKEAQEMTALCGLKIGYMFLMIRHFREKVMMEAHSFSISIHPGSTKMYRDLKHTFGEWQMKQDVATFWKWEEISMDSFTGLPTTQKRHDAIWWMSDRKCRAPICWDEVGERLIEGPELIEITNEKVAVAKEKLKEARSRQKSYADKHRRDLEFQAGDRVFLKVSPFRGVKRFGIKGKLSPRFIGPFEILERIGEVSYRLALPPQLSHVHDVFHVSLLRGYHYHPLHVASYPFDQIQPDMSLSEEPESILDRQERVMRNKVIPFVKILWKNHPEREATWETEESMRASYVILFVYSVRSRGSDCDIPVMFLDFACSE
ncbi:putative nucleotidyltransferase, ribonuclease H [Tanacetum coccineum]